MCFQAEDGIRDATVTGVQTCALPIYLGLDPGRPDEVVPELRASTERFADPLVRFLLGPRCRGRTAERRRILRSEERRVGKEGRGRSGRCWWEQMNRTSGRQMGAT